MAESSTVIVQPARAATVVVSEEMGRDAWAAYHRAIWTARLDAYMHARYFARANRWLGALSVCLQGTVLLGSASVLLTLLAKVDARVPIGVTIAVTIATAILQATGLVGRVQKATTLAEAWAVRCSFWDDAWIQVQDSKYLGDLVTLRAPESSLARVEAELGIPVLPGVLASTMRDIEKTDPFAKARLA